MSRKVLDSNIGEEDIISIMDGIVAQNPHLNARIEKVHNETNVYLCEILKIYPYDDKALVKVLDNNKKVLCKLSHELLCEGISIDYVPNGVEKKDDIDLVGRTYVEPFNNLYGIIMKVRWENLKDEYVFVNYVNLHDKSNLKSSSDKGELTITCGLSTISLTNERVNIMTPSLFVNGLPSNEPELDNYYDKNEMNVIVNSLNKSDSVYDDLLDVVDDYKQYSDDTYTLFRGDCWTVNNNFESSASITSESISDFTVTGTFRTKQDLIGIYWNSKDLIQHPYISYGERTNYKGVVLEFDYTMSGCKDFNYDNLANNPPSMTLITNSGETYYFNMFEFVTGNHVKIDFDNLVKTAGGQYINSQGQLVTIGNNQTKKVDVSDVKSIMFVLIPTNYESNGTEYTIMDNVDFNCEISNIIVTNGYICKEHNILEPHEYRLCEGYDDIYNFNPFRLCREMRKLGYTEWCDLYIGASHFYEKSGIVNDKITDLTFNHNRTGKMILDTSKPLNIAFRNWLDCYSKELKKNDCPNLVISVSMENLQCPEDWRQKQSAPSETSIVDNPNGFAMTGWIPSTFFYSPCHEDVLPYMQSVSEACLDIIVANGLPPILQLGEAWWWWNEYTDPVNKSPCFYDEKTKEKYRNEFGKEMPIYITPYENYDEKTIDWLNKQIVDYSWGLRSVVKSNKYENGLYMALFFPPSVIDEDRVPSMMRRVNYLSEIYSKKQLDILQLEDYDWVTGISEETKERDRSHHNEVYEIGQKLGFDVDELHYFGGFVQYPKDSKEYWKEIKKAMATAIEKGFSEVYVWAGSQIRRDGKMLGYDAYELVQKLQN